MANYPLFQSHLSSCDYYCTNANGTTKLRVKDAAGIVSIATDAPVVGAAPANAPTNIKDGGVYVEFYNNAARYWKFDCGTNAWTHVKDVSGAISTVTGVQADGKVIAIHADGQGNSVEIKETVTTLVDNANGSFTFTNEEGLETLVDFSADINVENFTYDEVNKQIVIAETDGTEYRLDITELIGEINTSVLANVLSSGNRIASHDNGNGVVTDIHESVTTLVDNGDGSYTYTNEAGVAATITTKTTIGSLDNVTASADVAAEGSILLMNATGQYEPWNPASLTCADVSLTA